MAQARATVVAGEEETRVTEALHDLDHVLGHDAEAIVDEVRPGFGQRAVAIAAQVGKNHVIALCQPCSNGVPKHVVVRIAMEEQQRRAGTTVAHANDGALGAHVEMLKPREQGRDFGAAPPGRIAGIIVRGRLGQHRRLLRYGRRGDGCCGPCRQSLNQPATAQALVDWSGLKMRCHLSLPRECRQSDAVRSQPQLYARNRNYGYGL